MIRLPQQSFQNTAITQYLTIENLLKAMGLSSVDVESYLPDDGSQAGLAGYTAALNLPLLPPPSHVPHLYLHVRMKPPVQADTPPGGPIPADLMGKWQKLEARWNTILIIEVNIDTLRLRMESLRGEVESASSKVLSTDEKMHAVNADVAQWNKAKSRARYAVPKVKEFVHRATWALGSPERKKLEELFKNRTPPESVIHQLDDIHNMLENLFKDRQILAAQGVTGLQEGKNSCDDVQKTYRTLQSNAASNATKKRVATRAKNKS
ncbi:MAG: hypothetical protein QM703_12775 [Gemmatales bacterium]